jgi:LCP family protein required for cell wall assembly
MPARRSVPRGASVLLVGALLGAACSPTEGPANPEAGPTSASPPAEEAAAPPVRIALARVRAVPVKGAVRLRAVRPVAERVGAVLADLYAAGFVDPAPSRAFGLFRADARRAARRDRNRLTLGNASRQVARVAHPRLRLRVEVLTDLGRNPRAVLASVQFAAKGISEEGVDTPIRHRARYVLQRFDPGWRIVAYSVKRRVAPDVIDGLPAKGSLFILAIGSDARVGQSVARSRADSLHVIGVNLREGKATILGIPRDSYVPIPGHGSNKINSALFFGGPQLVVRTVEGLTGIRMDGYVLTGFGGFQGLVNGVGGLTVRVPYRMHDAASGAFFKPGKARVNGKRALAFSRNRHDAPGGDFGRSLNQGSVILAALREFRHDMARDPFTLFRWIQVGRENVQTDLSVSEILALLYAAASIEPDRVRNRVVSGGGGTVGGASVVHLGSGARAMFRDLRRDGVLGS